MKEEQLLKLDKCHYTFSLDQQCEEEVVPARQLLGSSRYDLYAILLYIDHRVKCVANLDYAKHIYTERTRSITGFKLSEEGNTKKNTINDYFRALDNLIEDFLNDRYDENRTLVPVDRNYELIDGAHRVSCAAYFNKRVRILRFREKDFTRIDSKFLTDRLMPLGVADAMALEATRWHNDLYLIFLWPKSYEQGEKLLLAKELIRSKMDVFYEKESKMTYKSIRNLMIQIYGHMDWVGTIDNDFKSTYTKADEVWSDNGQCCFILAKAPSTQYVLDVKSQVRDIFQIELASCHSTDNMRETSLAVNALFNPNSFHFLQIANPTKFKESYKLLEFFKHRIHEKGLLSEDFIVDSSMVLSIFGTRQANDLDYYSLTGPQNLFPDNNNIEEHDETQQKYYEAAIHDLIIIPSNYFQFNEIKFVSLEQLLLFKKNRFDNSHDTKDENDIKIIKMLLSGKENKFRIWLYALKIFYMRKRRKIMMDFYVTRSKVLKKIGLYDFLKRQRDKLKKP